MNENQIHWLASMLTDDPDVLLELDTSMNPSFDQVNADPELEKNVTKTKATIDPMQDLENDQQEQQDKALIRPQVDKLKQAFDKTQTGVVQNKKTAGNMNQQSTDLDMELRNIQNILNQLDRNL